MPDANTLLVVSHVVHYRHGGSLFAYGPYAREIDIWADLFGRVLIASPCRDEEPSGDNLPFTRMNIEILPQRGTGGETFRDKASQILALPGLVLGLSRAMRKADAIHVRCPGNLGLLGIVLAPLFSWRRIAKYAGQWTDYPGEAMTYRLQKWLLRSSWWRGPVTVYGKWPGQPSHVIPFFTSILTDEQVRRASSSASKGRPSGPLRVLYVGRLSEAKHVDVLIAAIAELRRRSLECTCTIVGGGPQHAALAAQVESSGLAGHVLMTGAIPHEQVLGFYGQSDVLVLTSESEGWPKAIAEAMAFGLVCVGSDRGLIPQMLGEGRGLVVPPGDTMALADVLSEMALDPESPSGMRAAAALWARSYSLEGLRRGLADLLEEHWHEPFRDRLVRPAKVELE